MQQHVVARIGLQAIGLTRTAILALTVHASLAGCGSNANDGNGGSASGGTSGSGGVTGGTSGLGGEAGALPKGVPVLGNGAHELAAVRSTVIATSADGLAGPRDLEFSNYEAEQLWIVNHDTPSVTIIFGAGAPGQGASTRSSMGSEHFLSKVSAIAFGTAGTLATAQEEDQITQPTTPDTFMGPTLWTADSGIFDGGHDTHLDMLHNSPDAVGIAWDHDNVYWVFDGFHRSLTRFDFHADHGLGGEDHSDGEVARYVEGEVGYMPGVGSHVDLDHATGLLYVADTANQRIAVLDTSTGSKGAAIAPNYDDDVQYRMDGAKLWTLVDGKVADLVQPSGLALHDGLLFVGDNATGRIHAFAIDGRAIDFLQTDLAPGALGGIAFDPNGRLYFTDTSSARVLRIEPIAANGT